MENRKDLNNIGFLSDYLYEEYIEDREFTIGVIENGNGLQTLPVMEAKINKKVFSYHDKYSEAAKMIEIFPDKLHKDLDKNLRKKSLSVHRLMKLRHMSRVDVIVKNDGRIYFLEINSIPGCSAVSWVPKMIEKEGLNFSDLLQCWCENK